MRVAVIGQKWFGAQVLALAGSSAALAIAPSEGDRLAAEARARGVSVALLSGGSARDIRPGGRFDLLIAAHAHCFVPAELRACFRFCVGYHPSLLPLHRGKGAVEATIAAGDRVAGGTIYHLDNGYDTGAVAFQDSCFVPEGTTAAELWRARLAPMGLELVSLTLRWLDAFGALPARPQTAFDPKRSGAI